MPIYYLIRQKYNPKVSLGQGLIITDGLHEAERVAKLTANKYGKSYTVFKCTEQEQGTYRPEGDNGGKST